MEWVLAVSGLIFVLFVIGSRSWKAALFLCSLVSFGAMIASVICFQMAAALVCFAFTGIAWGILCAGPEEKGGGKKVRVHRFAKGSGIRIRYSLVRSAG